MVEQYRARVASNIVWKRDVNNFRVRGETQNKSRVLFCGLSIVIAGNFSTTPKQY